MKHTTMRKGFLLSVVAIMILATTACGSKFPGTYSNDNGSMILDVKSGGKASFTVMGETKPCTWTEDGNQFTFDCEGEGKTVFTRHDDESLTGQAGTIYEMTGALRKSK